MRGFEDSTNPVLLSIDSIADGSLAQFSIDGARAEATDYGVLCNVGNDRYFVPWARVRAIKQTQPVTPPGAAPQKIVVPTPPPTGGDGA